MDFIVDEMSGFKKPWFISGGWVIDIALGKVTREHKDIDICIFREDIEVMLEYFNEWDINVAIPGEQRLVKYESMNDLVLPRYGLHLFRDQAFIEILLTERQEDQVIFRKNREITMGLDDFCLKDDEGRPFVNPVWQLLFKGLGPREEDIHDFYTYLPAMEERDKEWLIEALSTMKPDSEWLEKLRL